jgi:hypothetical protein
MNWSEEKVQQAVKLFQSGFTATEIAPRFGVSRSSICGLLWRHGAKRGAKPVRREPVRKSRYDWSTLDPQITAAYEEGLSAPAIGKRIGVSLDATHRRLAILGLPLSKAPNWSDEEKSLLKTWVLAGVPHKEIAERLNRPYYSVKQKIGVLGLAKPIKRFPAEEDAYIVKAYTALALTEDIATALGRSVGVIRQRILHLGLRREAKRTILANRWGINPDTVPDLDLKGVAQVVNERVRAERAMSRATKLALVNASLDQMEQELREKAVDRRAAFRAAMLKGATLQQIGDRVKLTRERVRQIVYDVKPPSKKGTAPLRAILCERCGVAFKGHGNRHYCDQCVQLVKSEKMKQYNQVRLKRSIQLSLVNNDVTDEMRPLLQKLLEKLE